MSEVILTTAASVLTWVLSLPSFQRAHTVSVYLSMPVAEVDTWELCRRVLRNGKQLYIPRFSTLPPGATASDSTHKFTPDMRMLRVMDIPELDTGLTYNKWGIAEPPPTLADGTPREDPHDISSGGTGLDLIILPGVAFDVHGGRLGHGKGYYDRYVHKTRAMQPASPPATIALALREQIVEAVPRDAADEPCDTLVTPDGAYSFSNAHSPSA